MTEPARAMPELFACERLSARLTVKACGARFLRVRASMPGQQDYDSACDRCPIGEHHAKHGTLCPDTTTQKPATTITKETTTMGAPSEYTDQQKREAVRRVLINNKSQSELATELSVTSTTIRNWIKRWGTEVASDAMEAAAAGSAGTADVAGDVVEEKRRSPPKSSRAAKGPKPRVVERDAKPSKPTEPPNTRSTADQAAILDRDALEQLGADLAAAVRHIGDRGARGVVADAAWLLTQAAHV